MPSFSFKFYTIDGMKETEIEADAIVLEDQHGNRLELHPRKSDGEITLYAHDKLVIRPIAANCARVNSEK